MEFITDPYFITMSMSVCSPLYKFSLNKTFKPRIPLNNEFQCEAITKSFKETIVSNTCGAHGTGYEGGGGGVGGERGMVYIRIFQGSAV
jgi:hypothetical protein